jgi:hypothetical protein
MSDGALTQEEINEILADTEEQAFGRKKAWVLRNIKNIGTLNFNLMEDAIIIDALMNIIRMMMTMKKMENIYDGL